jgi:aryl sulfotransferase
VTRTIWLASYPKSGNTWLRMLVANLSAPDDKPADINDPFERIGIASERSPFDYLLLIDSGLLTHDEIDRLRPRMYETLARDAADDEDGGAEGAPQARLVKVHDAYTLTPNGEPLLAGERGADGAILIVRDPRDVAPSLANHSQISIDDAISRMNDQGAAFDAHTHCQRQQFRQKLLDWSAHAASWLTQTDIPVHLVRYEDMQVDAGGVLRAALAFAGRNATDAAIARAVDFADFKKLRAQEQVRGFREVPRPHAGGTFFRRGKAGSWREELNAAQVVRIELAHAPMMRRLGYALSSPADLAHTG